MSYKHIKINEWLKPPMSFLCPFPLLLSPWRGQISTGPYASGVSKLSILNSQDLGFIATVLDFLGFILFYDSILFCLGILLKI
jgi:hypothetical protein